LIAYIMLWVSIATSSPTPEKLLPNKCVFEYGCVNI
jgi:hypothetical protein